MDATNIFEKNKNNYTLTHAVFALISFVVGSMWYKIFFESMFVYNGYNQAYKTVFAIIFSLFTVAFFIKRKAKFGKDALFMLAFSLILSMRFAIYYDQRYSEIVLLCVVVLHVSMLLYLKCMGSGKTLDCVVGETAKAVFVEPFKYFHTAFASLSAIFKYKSDDEENKVRLKKIGRETGLIALGVFIAVPIILVVLSLLISDSFFEGFVQAIGDVLTDLSFNFNLLEYVNPFTVLVSMYIYSALFSADKKRTENLKPSVQYSVAPLTVVNTVLISLNIVYVLFVIAQFTGFAAMIKGVPPEGYTYADFARSGFFELCIVACINGAVLFYTDIFAVDNETKKHTSLYRYLLVAFTLFLIVTAASKMCLYISVYGFTPKRFYTLWFMLLLSIIFIMALFKIKNKQFKLSRYSVYVACAMFVLLFLVDFEGVAEYLNYIYF